ncbi:MAG: hypothetical protein HC840_12590 [Leptolyngbyaceae cyanobacterium RM2_2_4]|nr:hypothetical protein [Leptolyngbyaceae cyanobacterium SL_5_14]NJO50127.1 hypothetical protein [Leptolyngbyaceae cyanobacterium RM2_2_4]
MELCKFYPSICDRRCSRIAQHTKLRRGQSRRSPCLHLLQLLPFEP